MALGSAPELEQVHRLAGRELHHVADAICERNGVCGLLRKVLGERAVQLRGAFQALGVRFGETCCFDDLWNGVAKRGRERLPLDGEHAMSLQVAKGAVVRDDVEAVARALK